MGPDERGVVGALCAEEGLDDPRDAVRARVHALLARVARLGPVALPVDVEVVGSVADIVYVRDVPRLGVVAQVRPRTDGRLVVDRRAEDPAGRKRFSLAHEIAHTLMPGFWGAACRGGAGGIAFGGEDSAIESLCDIAAAELLMPAHLVTPWLAGRPWTIETVMDLATTAAASLEAAGRRVVDLADVPLTFAVVTLRRSKSEEAALQASSSQPALPGFDALPPTAPKFRVVWSYRSLGAPFLPREKSLASDPFIEAETHGISYGEAMITASSRDVAVTLSVAYAPVRRDDELGDRYLAVVRERSATSRTQ